MIVGVSVFVCVRVLRACSPAFVYEVVFEGVAEHVGCNSTSPQQNLACLLQLPASELLEGQMAFASTWRPVIDGVEFDAHPAVLGKHWILCAILPWCDAVICEVYRACP